MCGENLTPYALILSNIQGRWWMIFSGHIAQRRACTYWQDPSSLPVTYVGQSAPRNCHAPLLIQPLQLTPPHDYFGSCGSFPHVHTQVYNGVQVLKPEPMIRNPPLRCFAHGVTICRQHVLGATWIHLQDLVLSARRRCSGSELFELTDR